MKVCVYCTNKVFHQFFQSTQFIHHVYDKVFFVCNLSDENKNNFNHCVFQSSSKKAPTRYDKHVRAFAEKKKFSKAQRAVTISIEGRNMAL